MCKNSCCRGPFHKKHGKRAQTLLHSRQQHRYHIYWSLWRYFGWIKSLLVLWKILILFVLSLSVSGKYSLLNRDNFMQPIQILVSQKQKTFSEFFAAFPKSTLNFENFQKKNNLIADVFPKLRTPQKVIR